MARAYVHVRRTYPREDVLELAGPVAQRPDVHAHVVVPWGRRDGERVPATNATHPSIILATQKSLASRIHGH